MVTTVILLKKKKRFTVTAMNKFTIISATKNKFIIATNIFLV
jgi:hypothetical protein